MAIKRREGFGVNLCSVCDAWCVTFGEQMRGGVRWCSDCLQHSFGWVQFTADQRERILAAYRDVAGTARAQRALALGESLTPEQRKALGIGESRLRVLDAELRDAGGKGIYRR